MGPAGIKADAEGRFANAQDDQQRDYPVTGKALSAEEMNRFYAILAEEGVPNIIKE